MTTTKPAMNDIWEEALANALGAAVYLDGKLRLLEQAAELESGA